MNLTLLIVLIYLIAITGIIFFTGRKISNYKDFALGGGLPWVVVVGTMFASTVGGATMIGYVGNYKVFGMQWAMIPISMLLTGPIIGLLISPRVRKLHQYTTGDLLRIRYGRTSRIIAAALNCIGEFAVCVSMMASFAAMVNGYLGVNYLLAMIVAIVVFSLTAMLGGLKGVAWTDTLQAVVIIITVAIAAVLCVGKLGTMGGFKALPKNLWNPLEGNMPWTTMSGIIISLVGMMIVSQSLFTQRINACRTPNDARKASLVNSCVTALFMIFGVGTIGICASVITPPDVTGNNVITSILSDMPVALGALYAAAILAAVLTTANSLVLSSSMSFVRDILGEFKKLNDKQNILVSRIFIVAAMILAFLMLRFSSSVIRWILITYTVLASIVFPLYAGLLSKKATPLSGILSLALGGGAAIIWEILGQPGKIHSLFPGLLFNIIGFYLGFLSHKKSSAEQIRVVECFTAGSDYFESGASEINT
jgi:SSS family solute:Na+ symporter